MGLLYRIVLYFALINVAVSVLFDENDVRCSPDGSIHVKMMGRGNITARIHAFGENGPCRRRLLREDVLRFERQGQQVRFLIWVLRPFQEYFTYIEPIVHQRWAKTGGHGEKPPDHP